MRAIPFETHECIKFYQEMVKRGYGDNIFHIPNGGKRNIVQAAILKKMGLTAGVSDYFLAMPKDKYSGMWIEMKRKKGGTVSADQKLWMEKMIKLGYAVSVCKGAEAAINAVEKYLNGEYDYD